MDNTVVSAVVFLKNEILVVTATADNLFDLRFLIMADLQQQAAAAVQKTMGTANNKP